MGGQWITLALKAKERTMSKAMDDDAPVIMTWQRGWMSFLQYLALVHVISGGRRPQTKIVLADKFPRE